ncbi:PepSY domain-containing protein [Haloferula sp.]|uniref:PepSY domain-containing protein n=1 Tax=Haloferula sp. TaxID=2497595 RepID=UPI003C769C9C
MPAKRIARPLHRRLALWLVAPLLVSLITGILYRVGRSWFGMEKPTGQKILDFHTGMVLGESASMIYTAFTGLGLLVLALSGARLLLRSRASRGARGRHRLAAWALLIPLIATSVTGLGYHFGGHWFGWDESTLKLLMNIHQGSWLGPVLRPFYILFVGGGLLMLIVTGVAMLRSKTSSTKSEA